MNEMRKKQCRRMSPTFVLAILTLRSETNISLDAEQVPQTKM